MEFVDGLALGQFTPGPLLMLAAYVGYKVAGIAGAVVAAAAAFLPSFILMLALLPVLDRVRTYTWTRAVLRGMGPAVVGILAVSLFRLAPYAIPDALAIVIFAGTVTCLLLWRVAAIKLMIAGALVGVLRADGHAVRRRGSGARARLLRATGSTMPPLRQAEAATDRDRRTDVAKGAASVVLTEPGLTNIVALVEQGGRSTRAS